MKQIKITFVLTVLMSMMGLQAFATFDTSIKVQVGDLYYYLDYANNQAQVTSKRSGKYTGEITIPSSITYSEKAYSVTSIGVSAFLDCTDLISVTISSGVTSIDNWAFYNCTGLTSITIPNSVTSIGSYVFYNCSGLKKVIVSDIAAWCEISFGSNPLFYAKHLYSDENTEITNLVIPNSVTSIGSSAFANCSGLTSVTIPNSVTSIGGSAFSYCTGLTSVTIGKRVISIGNSAFAYCSSLTSITLGNSVTSIGNSAFSDCKGLTSVTFPNGVTSIGDNTF